MKYLLIIILLFPISSSNSKEFNLKKDLINLYKNNSPDWKIALKYYELAKYYSKNRYADKAFIMLKRAHDFGYNNFSEVYNKSIFLSVRQLKYFKYFKKLGKIPQNLSVEGFFIDKSGRLRRIYTSILNILLKTKPSPYYNKLFKKYKKYTLIKSYSFGANQIFKVFYKAKLNKNIFKKIKFIQYSYGGYILLEYNFINYTSVFYFYYKNNFWRVAFSDINGKIKWTLIENQN